MNHEITPEDIETIRELPVMVRMVAVTSNETKTQVSALAGAMTQFRDEQIRTRADIMEAQTQTRAELLDQLSRIRAEFIDAQTRTRAEIMARIDRLQEALEFVREDTRVNWATANTAINRNLSTRNDIDNLLQTIAAMERRFQVLSGIVDGLRDQGARKPDASDDQ